MIDSSATRRREGGNASDNSSLDTVNHGELRVVERKPYYESEEDGENRHITLRARLKHFTWAWFTSTMSTGGFALLISIQPHKFNKMMTLGTIVYLLDITLFVALVTTMITRFILHPKTLRRSFTYPREGLFFATFWLSLPTICGGMENYGGDHVGPWLPVVLRVLFWIYCACTTIVAVVQYWYLFAAKQMTLKAMAPGWVLPVFPAMLCGTFASLIASTQPYDQRMAILVAGVTFQGLGILVSMLMYSIFILRLMQHGLPPPNARPGMFICVGPPSFTALALIGMGNALPADYSYFAEYPGALVAVKALAVFTAIFLWALAFWWFCIAVLSCLAGIKEMTFHLVWYAFIFPNTGFTIATIKIGESLESQGIQWVGSIMSICIFATWLFVVVNHIKAVVTKQIMMPGKSEDHGGEYDPIFDEYE